MITSLLASALIGAMVLFNAAVTPVVFSKLDAEHQAAFLRAAFPRLFIFGLVLSVLVAFAGAWEGLTTATTIATCVAIGFGANAFQITPAVNEARDAGNRRRFLILHAVSVGIFVLQLAALVAIVYITFPGA